MHESFLTLDDKKRDKIINAAIKEFSVKGYKNASTNEIVKNAEISKGSLFHYFPSKFDLFKFLCEYSVDFFLKIAIPYTKDMPSDIFERWIAFLHVKIEVSKKYPDMVSFSMKSFQEPDLQNVIMDKFSAVKNQFLQQLHSGIDFSKFKEGIDIQKALQLVWWTLESYSLSRQKEFDYSKIDDANYLKQIFDDVWSYFHILEKAIYKKEFWRS